MTFLECVNRIFRLNGIIRGDTDPITSFSDTQHNASVNIAQIAVQDELTYLVADRLIPSEFQTSGTITLVANTRTYSLASGFLRFFGIAHLTRPDGIHVFEWDGGLQSLQLEYFNYDTDTGDPVYWYWEPGTTKQIGLFQIPSYSGDVYAYQYEGSVMVSDAADDMPFHNDEENFMFAQMAGRRFKYLFEDVKNQTDIQAVLEADRTYRASKASIMNLIRGTNPQKMYTNLYV